MSAAQKRKTRVGHKQVLVQVPKGNIILIPRYNPTELRAIMDSPGAAQPVMCEVCGTYFESRRGLSSHARLHLRQLGVALSESSGAPIDLLYQLIRERDGCLPDFKADASEAGKTSQHKSSMVSEPEDTSGVKTTSQTKDCAESPTGVKESTDSPLPSSSSGSRPIESRTSKGSSSSFVEHQTPTKPLWAPLETDAPISLDTTNEVHVCQLCGCWYETRKGLASHARAHLRQLGIPESQIQGSPIELLYRMMEEEDLKPISTEQHTDPNPKSPSGSPSKRPSCLSSPPASPLSKRTKTADDCACVLCGEQFESRKGLASHSRSHLNQLGVVDLLGKTSAIETIQELVTSGVLEAIHPLKTNSAASSSVVSSPAPGESHTSFPSTTLSPSPANCTSLPPVNRAPKAKKGFRLAVDPLHRKPKPEPVEIEVSAQSDVSNTKNNSTTDTPTVAAAGSKPLDGVSSTDVQSPPTVLCEYCGQLFDSRKALSCHARAHLRQLGLTWSIRTSPIDVLKEVMIHGVDAVKESSSGKGAWSPQGSRRSLDSLQSGELDTKPCASPLDYSLKEKSPSGKSGVANPDASCELCGFDFENRKALASHARAHLRQLGIIEWKADGATSPIELLSELIRKDPVKVAAITQRYRMGDLYIKKSHRSVASPSLPRDSESVSGQKPSTKDSGVTAGSSRQSQDHTQSAGTHSDPCVRSPRGLHPPKHIAPVRERNQDSHPPSRSGSIPALLPKPPLTPLVKLVGKVYFLKCRFCDKVFHGPLSVQAQWISHLQKHILSLGYKGKASPPAASVAAPALVHPVAV